jgi:hypothetical protein
LLCVAHADFAAILGGDDAADAWVRVGEPESEGGQVQSGGQRPSHAMYFHYRPQQSSVSGARLLKTGGLPAPLMLC